jgi:hypothetical protein
MLTVESCPKKSVNVTSAKGITIYSSSPGPEEVQGLIHDLDSHGVKIREVQEMGNPLEERYT